MLQDWMVALVNGEYIQFNWVDWIQFKLAYRSASVDNLEHFKFQGTKAEVLNCCRQLNEILEVQES